MLASDDTEGSVPRKRGKCALESTAPLREANASWLVKVPHGRTPRNSVKKRLNLPKKKEARLVMTMMERIIIRDFDGDTIVD